MKFLIHVNTLIEDEQSRILLVREAKPHNYGLWNLPGGHLETGEALMEGAEREVFEETGLTISITHLCGIYNLSKDNHFVQFVFYSDVISGNPVPLAGEILECAWFRREDVLAMKDEEFLNAWKIKSLLQGKAIPKYPLELICDQLKKSDQET